jgi:prevent-host-death family protein
MRVRVGEARDKLTQLIAAVERGEKVTICRHGKPVADLVRSSEPTRAEPKFGTLKGRIRILDPDWAKAMSDEEINAFLEGRD